MVFMAHFHHDTLTRVLCCLAGDLEAVQCALCVCSHWHLLGKDPSLWIALRRARWGQNQIEGEEWQENSRWEFTRRASGLGLQGGEAEEVNVSECLGIERRFSGVFELHSSGLALTVVSGKVVLLDLDKGKSFGFDAMTLEFNKVAGKLDKSKWDTDGREYLAIEHKSSSMQVSVVVYRLPERGARAASSPPPMTSGGPTTFKSLEPIFFKKLPPLHSCTSISVQHGRLAISAVYMKQTKLAVLHLPGNTHDILQPPPEWDMSLCPKPHQSKARSGANALCLMPECLAASFSKCGVLLSSYSQGERCMPEPVQRKDSCRNQLERWWLDREHSYERISQHPTHHHKFLIFGGEKNSAKCHVLRLRAGTPLPEDPARRPCIAVDGDIDCVTMAGEDSLLMDACWHEDCVAMVYKSGALVICDPRTGEKLCKVFKFPKYPFLAARLCSLSQGRLASAVVEGTGSALQVRIHRVK